MDVEGIFALGRIGPLPAAGAWWVTTNTASPIAGRRNAPGSAGRCTTCSPTGCHWWILTKLSLGNRTQIALLAHDTGRLRRGRNRDGHYPAGQERDVESQ